MHPIALLRYLRFPLQTAPLILIGIFSVLLIFFAQGGLFGLYLVVILSSWFFKYGFALLDEVVQGRSEAPVLSAEMANPLERRPIGLLLILISLYVLTDQLALILGEIWIEALRVGILALVPSMIAAMSITGRVRDAINPLAVCGTVLRIPVAYITLLIAISVMWLIPVALLRAMAGSLPNVMHKESLLPWYLLSEVGFRGLALGAVGLVLFMYLWLAMFACIGGTIFERRKELEYEAAASPERVAARANAEVEQQRDKIMDRIFAELRGGALGNAGNTVRNRVEQAQNPLDECRWLYARAMNVDQRLAAFLAHLTLPRLLGVKATGEALKMLRERLAADAEFRPANAGQLLQLANLARAGGDPAMARRLLADFTRHYPNDALASAAMKLQDDLVR